MENYVVLLVVLKGKKLYLRLIPYSIDIFSNIQLKVRSKLHMKRSGILV